MSKRVGVRKSAVRRLSAPWDAGCRRSRELLKTTDYFTGLLKSTAELFLSL